MKLILDRSIDMCSDNCIAIAPLLSICPAAVENSGLCVYCVHKLSVYCPKPELRLSFILIQRTYGHNFTRLTTVTPFIILYY